MCIRDSLCTWDSQWFVSTLNVTSLYMRFTVVCQHAQCHVFVHEIHNGLSAHSMSRLCTWDSQWFVTTLSVTSLYMRFTMVCHHTADTQCTHAHMHTFLWLPLTGARLKLLVSSWHFGFYCTIPYFINCHNITSQGVEADVFTANWVNRKT